MAMKLLLVEDSLSIQNIVETTCTQAGFEVIVADDALDGLQKAQTLLPDIVLADASMPDLDGFQLCQQIRHSANGRQVPVVLLTSGFTAYDKAKGDRAGVTTHLAKPFEPQVLLALVAQLVPMGHSPAYPAATVAAMLPRLGGDMVEASTPHAREPEESDNSSTTEPSLERVEAAAVPPGRASELAVELLGETWSAVMLPSHTAEPPPPTATVGGNASVSPTTVPATHTTMSGADSDASARHGLYQTLGQQVIQVLRETLAAHLAATLAELRPQILDTVRDVVRAQMPDVLEVLLQQEIAKLKQAVEQDQHNA
jgi:DNA-binding response OmpR family regulator